MKKIISLLLVLVMCAALFAGCNQGGNDSTTTVPVENNTADALANAKAYIKSMYKDSDGTKTVNDYSVVSVVSIGTTNFDIEWTVEVTSGDASCVEIADDGTTATVTIVNSKPEEEVVYNLVGTITDGNGNTETVSFSHNIPAVEASGVKFVDAPEAGVAYKFAVEQNELGATLYFSGEMSGYYMATTEDPLSAVDVYVEEADGGVRLYFNNAEGTKTYIDLVLREGYTDKANISLTTEPTCVYTWDNERNTMVANLGEANFYIGTYSTYNTLSVSNFSYIEDVSKVGVSQFVAGFCTVNVSVSAVETPEVGVAYKYALEQNEIGSVLYFVGEMNGYYMASSENIGDSVDVYLEEADGAYRLYFNDAEGTKTYIDLILREGYTDKANISLTTEPTCVYTWDAERGTLVSNLGEASFYIGTYSTYVTFSVSNTSYIEDVSNIGVSQFPAGLYVVDMG